MKMLIAFLLIITTVSCNSKKTKRNPRTTDNSVIQDAIAEAQVKADDAERRAAEAEAMKTEEAERLRKEAEDQKAELEKLKDSKTGGDADSDGDGDNGGESKQENCPLAKNIGIPPSSDTLKGKIMAGYQGWFQAGGDWRHWFSGGSQPSLSNLTFDMWPDMREYDVAGLVAPEGFRYSNDSPAGLFHAPNSNVTNLHVKWMKEYGIDGVFVQRFVLEAHVIRNFRDQVLKNIRSASEKYGRVFANMYDISDFRSSDRGDFFELITQDWEYLVSNLKITESQRYLQHNGRPVVAIWGFGVEDKHRNIADVNQARKVIQWFKSKGVTVMGGVAGKFLDHSQEWIELYKEFDIVSPWNVGRYNSDSEFNSYFTNIIMPQAQWAKDNTKNYLPVVFPGFSWANLKKSEDKRNEIPRYGGKFYWHQLRRLMNSDKIEMIYVAMFDEVDEGTAIFKIAENLSQIPWYPNGIKDKFLTLDADAYKLPSDWYLRLTGLATQALKEGQKLKDEIPSFEACKID